MRRKAKHAKQQHLTPIIVLFLVILATIGCFAYRNKLLKTNVLPTPTATPNPMAKWMTYTNTKYNFSFKFPGNFVGQGSISGPATGTLDSLRSFTDPNTLHEGTSDPFNGFSLYVVTRLGTTNFDKYIGREIAAMNIAKYTGMKNPIKVQLTNGAALVSKDGNQAYYYLPTPNKKMIVVFAYLQTDVSFKQTFDQILSTFRFTE